MFGFRKTAAAPPLCPGNPGTGVEAEVAFASGGRSWTESVNVVDLAADVLRARGYAVSNEKTWLGHGDSGLTVQPLLADFQPLEDGGVRTVTTVQVNHPTLTPDGVFEYQHSTGENMADALSKGFDQWVQTDFVTLLDALRPRPQTCTAMEMKFPAKGGKPERVRRAVLGPVAHLMQSPPDAAGAEAAGDEHPFCPCCLLTRSFEAFAELIEADGFYGLRLFAARDAEGVPQADCRVNGQDWEKGARALRQYASTWPEAGVEFRKQYVVLQTMPARAPEGAGAPR